MLVLEHMLSLEHPMLSLEHCPSVLDSVTIGPCPNRNYNPAITTCKIFLTIIQETGLAIGGKSFNQYVMLEVHYNNQQMEAGKRLFSAIGDVRFQKLN